jgi:glutamate racemase
LNNAPVGVFDSGIGGLTVVREIRRILPRENIVYLGDTARLPYGTKSVDAIIQYSLENMSFLLSRGVKYIVIACYSSTSVALEIVQQRCPVPVIGVIRPGVKRALKVSVSGKIGVIGTSLTIYSGAYEKVFQELSAGSEVIGRPCPLLVSLVEEGWLDHPATRLIVESYLEPLRDDGIDTLLLGCTHFPLLMDVFKKTMGAIQFVDASHEVSEELSRELERLDSLSEASIGDLMIYLTDLSMNFREIGERFLGEPMKNVSRVSLKKTEDSRSASGRTRDAQLPTDEPSGQVGKGGETV